MFLTGVMFYFFIVIITILLGADLRWFIDFPSFIFILLSNIAILITTNSIKNFLYGIKLLVVKNIEVDSDKIKESIEVFSLLDKASLIISILGILIGFISMSGNLAEPSSLGVHMAVLLLVPLYSAMINIIMIKPAKFMLIKIQRRSNQSSSITIE